MLSQSWANCIARKDKMRFQIIATLLAASASVAFGTPTVQALKEWQQGSGGKSVPDHTSPRPSVSCHPKHPHVPPPAPPARTKVCYVESHDDGLVTDDSDYILDALHSCNNGGHVVFKEGTEYLIGTALDLTFLKHIDLGMNLLAANDMFPY